MIAVPFIDTMLSDQYRVFVLQEFNHEFIETFFNGWKCKDMVGWTKVTNYESDSTIEFHGKGNNYKITNPSLVGEKGLLLPYPQNLDQFICDCHRSLVLLYWNQSTIDSSENRIFFMNQKEIKNNITNLLTKIEKS